MFLHAQGELALGSRLKAVSESLYAAANAAYREAGHDIDAHWFPVLRYLQVLESARRRLHGTPEERQVP